MIGRGLLGKWGPNHAADPLVTRYIIILFTCSPGKKTFCEGTCSLSRGGLELTSGKYNIVNAKKSCLGTYN